MRAMILKQQAPFRGAALEREERASPQPGPLEVAIAVEACGVCRIVPGHQAAGRVIGVGEGVAGFRPGDAVGVGWLASTCGQCRFCASGRENLCKQATFTGCDRDGGYAEVMTARSEWVYHLPAGFSANEAAPLLCAGIIGYRSLKLSGLRPGGRLGLFGFGASAHLAIQVAHHWGCSVYAFSREPRHRDLAISMGAVWAGATQDEPPVALDAAVTFAPSGEVVAAALARLDRGATVAVNAVHMTPIPSLAYERVSGERALRSVQSFTRRDAEEFLALAAAIPIRAETEVFPLGRADEALGRIQRGEILGAAVLEIGGSRTTS
jgi:propanol-preferring alcohol dehydrogenase